MRTDRELLELAAKAAGIAVPMERDRLTGRSVEEVRNGFFKWTWNPLTDDGDALRLAATVPGLDLQWIIANAWQAHENHAERCAYVRRAIVRAAAEIGAQVAEPAHNEIGEGK